MRCVICKHGETKSGLVTVTLERIDVLYENFCGIELANKAI